MIAENAQQQQGISIMKSALLAQLQHLTRNAGMNPDEVIRVIERHSWTGNIRQLINVIRATLYTASSSFITVQDLPVDFISELEQFETKEKLILPEFISTETMSLMDWECHAVKEALKNCAGNISLAAKTLGITRTTLYKKIDRFGLDRNLLVID